MIEGLCYVANDVQPGAEISYGRLIGRGEREDAAYEADDRYVRCTVITAAECGDYSGQALVGESNYRVLKEEFPWLVEIYGSHGYKALAYLGKRENQSDALIEAIDSLTDYPLYSDDDHSALESEKEGEAWDSDGASDFRRALQDLLDEADPLLCTACDDGARSSHAIDCDVCNGGRSYEHDPDLITDEDLYSLWRDGCDAFNVNGGSGFVNEQGDSIHFYIDEWIEGYNRQPSRVNRGYGDHTGEPFSEWIKTLAIVCRVHDVSEDMILVTRDAWQQDPNGDHTIALLKQISPDYQGAILYAFEWEQARNVSQAKEQDQ